MRVRTIYSPSSAQIRQQQARPKHRKGKIVIGVALIVVIALAASHLLPGKASAATSVIGSGLANYCLDIHNNGTSPGTIVDNYTCNNSQAQSWTITYDHIQHGSNLCLSAQDNSKATGSAVVVNYCSLDPGQVWLRDQNGYENPNSGLCLALPANQKTGPVTIATCTLPSQTAEKWAPSPPATQSSNSCLQGTKGERIACFATKEWNTWQSEPANHPALLNTYTNGTPYEAWCADFVSYVYREAGYPFTQGESDGWDENNANNIQNMGFTAHDPSTYTPKSGDVAYFNYNGGHVEIVVSGGKTPTFVYGNSGTVDPTTSNGQMAANTITNDGTLGNLVYYLSPN